MPLDFYLCYVSSQDLFNWIKENNLCEENFFLEKQKWERKVSKKAVFFSRTELLLVYGDNLLLKVSGDNHASFLVKTYQLEHQEICQKIFQERKNIILINSEEWEGKKNFVENFFVLWKDEETSEKKLSDWLQKKILH